MPLISRRPSQTRLSRWLPSYSSATRAGTLTRGRSVTLRTEPQTLAVWRSTRSAIGVPPSRSVSACSSPASSSAWLLVRRAVRRCSRPDSSRGRTRSASVMVTATSLSADLGDLGAALEGGEVLRRRRLRGLATSVLLLRGQLQRQQVPGRHGLLAADDDRRADHLDERGGGVLVDRGPAAEDRAQEPARAVDPEEAGR